MTAAMKPQTLDVLRMLERAGTCGITAIDALRPRELGGAACFRLAARIAELRAAGHDITTVYETADDGARYARYILRPPTPVATTGTQEAIAWT